MPGTELDMGETTNFLISGSDTYHEEKQIRVRERESKANHFASGLRRLLWGQDIKARIKW